jgi:putative SOS response-associated peptidase YedK
MQNEDLDAAGQLTVPYPDGELGAYPVSMRLNRPKNDDPTCSEPVK